MPRGREKQAAAVAVESQDNSPAAAVAETSPPSAQADSAVQEPPFEPAGTYTLTAEEIEAASNEGRGRFRSWASDSRHGYSKLTDNERQRIIIQFDNKPSEDVITAIKGAGFQFQPEYHGLKSAWVRYNDFEGRLQVEAIEKLILETGPQSRER